MRRVSYWQRVARQLGATPVLVPGRPVWPHGTETRRAPVETEVVVPVAVPARAISKASAPEAPPPATPSPETPPLATPPLAAPASPRPSPRVPADAPSRRQDAGETAGRTPALRRSHADEPREETTALDELRRMAGVNADAERPASVTARTLAALTMTEATTTAAASDAAITAAVTSTPPRTSRVTVSSTREVEREIERESVEVHIGAVEVHVDRQARKTAPAGPPAPLARGFASRFGMRQE